MSISKTAGKQGGFTLIELMVLVVIIGILAALAIPRFMQSSIKAKQSEAKQILKQIYTLERTYHLSHGYFWGESKTASALIPDGFKDIGVEIPPTAIYTYTIKTAGINYLLVEATCSVLDDDKAFDIWQIDECGSLSCINDDVVL